MSRLETKERLTDGNTTRPSAKPPTPNAAEYIHRFRFMISRQINAVRSGIAGAVALGSAYAVSMPQKAEADIIYQADISSHSDVNEDLNPYGYNTVYYNSPQVNFRDTNGNLIPGGLTNKVVLLYVRDSGTGITPVGGLTLEANNDSASGWVTSYSNIGENLYLNGLQPGEIATNGLNGGSYWIGLIDHGGSYGDNGTVGTYTLYDNQPWDLQSEPNESMSYYGDLTDFENQYFFKLNEVPEHPGNGTGPVTIGSIDIYAPWAIVPEPATTCAFLTASLDAGFPTLAVTNFPPSSTVTVQRCEDLMATNWLSITNLSAGFTNWIDYTLTGDWDRVFYKLAR